MKRASAGPLQSPEAGDERLRLALPGCQFVAASREIAQVDPVEATVAGMAGHCTEHAREPGREMQRPEPARRLAEYAARAGLGNRPEATVDFRHQFIDQITGV